MLKKVTIAVGALLVVALCAVFVVSKWNRALINNPGDAERTVPDVVDSTTKKADGGKKKSKEEESSDSAGELTTVPMPDYVPSETFVRLQDFKVKGISRKFNGQSDRIKRYRNFFNETYVESEADVFLFDITHDGQCDLIVVTPLKDDDGKKTVGAIVQLFTITNGNTVTEIFRDFGGFSASGGSFCCYVTEREEGDCMLISKDDLIQGKGKLSYSVFYVLEDATVINLKSAQYVAKEAEDLENEDALNIYSADLEADIDAAHTTIVDYRSPYAVTSKASDVLK